MEVRPSPQSSAGTGPRSLSVVAGSVVHERSEFNVHSPARSWAVSESATAAGPFEACSCRRMEFVPDLSACVTSRSSVGALGPMVQTAISLRKTSAVQKSAAIRSWAVAGADCSGRVCCRIRGVSAGAVTQIQCGAGVGDCAGRGEAVGVWAMSGRCTSSSDSSGSSRRKGYWRRVMKER